MSNHESKTPRHARHFAQNPTEATFRFSPVAQDGSRTEDQGKKDTNGSADNGNHAAGQKDAAQQHVIDPEATQLATPDIDPEATQLVSPGAYDPEAARLVGSNAQDPETTRLVDSGAAAPMAGDPNATRLVSPGDDATRLITPDYDATQLVSPGLSPEDRQGIEAARRAEIDSLPSFDATPNPADLPAIDEPDLPTYDQLTVAASDAVAAPGNLAGAGTPADAAAAAGAAAADVASAGQQSGSQFDVTAPVDAPLYPDVSDRPHSPEHAEVEDPTQPDGVRLAKNEVAAVPVQHTGYENDNASPYISKRQAERTPEQLHHRRNVVVAIVTIAILAALAAGGVWFYHSFMQNTQTEQAPQYDTATIESGEFLDSIDDSTVLRPVQQQNVTPQVEGTIATVSVKDGDTVRKGDTLYTLQNQTITDEATKAKQAVDDAQKDVDTKTTDSTNAQKDLDDANKAVSNDQTAIEQLLQLSSGTLSSIATEQKAQTDANNPSDTLKQLEQSVTDAEAKLSDSDKSKYNDLTKQLQTDTDKVSECQAKVDSAKSALDSANQNVTTLKQASDKAAAQEQKLTVTAPFSGTISDVSDSAAQGSAVTSSTQLCTVSDTSELILVMNVPASQIGQVTEEREVRLSFPDNPDVQATGKITKNGSNATQNGTEATYPVTITIEDPDSSLAVGTAVNASIVLQSIPNSLIVPIQAVQKNSDGSTYLDVLLDPSRGIDTKVEVTVKATSSTQAAVESPNIQSDTKVILPSSSDGSSSDSGTASSDASSTTADASTDSSNTTSTSE